MIEREAILAMDDTLELTFLHADACSYAASMARSEDSTLARLEVGRRLFEQLCGTYGGRVIDKVGDNMLLAFNAPAEAYLAAHRAMAEIRKVLADPGEPQLFQYRIGIAHGKVRVRDGALYGHCINTAARICSLVYKGNIGVEAGVWSHVVKFTDGCQWTGRRLFAKPDEPFVEFMEIVTDPFLKTGALVPMFGRNEPLIAIMNQQGLGSSENAGGTSGLFEALNWEFSSYFSSYDWRTQLYTLSDISTAPSTIAADYVVRCGASVSRAGARVFASLTSPHMKGGIQTFSRDSLKAEDGLAQVMALVSLVGSAIAQSERERANQQRSTGAHQLVAAGRSAIAGFSENGFKKGMKQLEMAQVLDPEYPLQISSVARAHAIAWRFGWMTNEADHMVIAQELGERAHSMEPNDARCEADLAFVRFWANETSQAIWHYERAVEVLPYHVELAADAGAALIYVGQGQKAANILERSIANIPNDVDYRLWSLGDVYFALQEYRKSLNWLSRMRDKSQAQRLMAANKVRLGLDPSPHVANVMAAQPDFRVSRWISILPFSSEREQIDFEEALLAAGFPP
jgi:adenylate cyclase